MARQKADKSKKKVTQKVKPNNRIRNRQISARLPEVLFDRLQSEADETRHSVADVVIFALEARYGLISEGKKATK